MSDLSWLNPTPHAIAVYASRPLSPVAAQHSLPSGRYSLLGPDSHRLDRTSLRLAHVAVGTRFSSRPPHRTVRAAFPHTALYGSFFVKGASRHFCRALLLHSFVQPAPRAFFHPDRTLPSPSRAAAVKDGASSAPPKACP